MGSNGGPGFYHPVYHTDLGTMGNVVKFHVLLGNSVLPMIWKYTDRV